MVPYINSHSSNFSTNHSTAVCCAMCLRLFTIILKRIKIDKPNAFSMLN